jgi:hypothetical protein
MTIESTLERIATALETIASNGTPLGQLTEPTGPKERKRRTTASGAAETANAASATATNATEADARTAKSDPETDDLFGEEKAPAKEETKKATIEQVKAALVSVQTALKDKKHAIKLLAKHTTGHAEVLSKLPESAYAALIAEAAESVKKGAVA